MKFKDLSKKQWGYFIISCASVVFGILFCIFSQSLVESLRTFLSVAVLVYGAFYLFSYCVISFDSRDLSTLIKATLSIALGLFVIFIPSFFVMAISLVVVILGIMKILFVSKLKKESSLISKDRLVIGIVEIVLASALMVLCNVNIPSLIVTIYLGVLLILEGLLGIIFLIAHKNAEEIVISEVMSVDDNKIAEETSNKE